MGVPSWFRETHGLPDEARVERLLAIAGGLPDEERRAALRIAASACVRLGRFEEALHLLDGDPPSVTRVEALAGARRIGEAVAEMEVVCEAPSLGLFGRVVDAVGDAVADPSWRRTARGSKRRPRTSGASRKPRSRRWCELRGKSREPPGSAGSEGAFERRTIRASRRPRGSGSARSAGDRGAASP